MRQFYRTRQLSIRGLLLIILVCAIVIAQFRKPVAQYWLERGVANAIRADGGSLKFTHTQPTSLFDRWLHAIQPQVFDRIGAIDFRGAKVNLYVVKRLAYLTNLTEVDCGGCEIDGNHLVEIRKVATLACLRMKDNPKLDDDDLSLLHGHPILSTIEIDGTNISPFAYRKFAMASPLRGDFIDRNLYAAAPNKMSSVARAIDRVRPFDKNSFSFCVSRTNVSLFKHHPQECLLICQALKDSEITLRVSMVENQVSEVLIAELQLLDVREVVVYGTEYTQPKLFDLLNELKQLEKLSYKGVSLSSKLNSLARLNRLKELCLLTREGPSKEDLEELKPITSLRALVLSSSPTNRDMILTMLPQLKQAVVGDQLPFFPNDSPDGKLLWMLHHDAIGRFDAQPNEVTGRWSVPNARVDDRNVSRP